MTYLNIDSTLVNMLKEAMLKEGRRLTTADLEKKMEDLIIADLRARGISV